MHSETTKSISAALVKARLSCTMLDGFPGDIPETLEVGYAIQAQSIADWPQPVIGWKVAGVAPDYKDKFTVNRLVGPVFQDKVKRCAQNGRVTVPVYRNGFIGMEAEYVVILKDDLLLPNRDVTLDDIPKLIGAVHIGAEVASSPMKMINVLGPTVIVSDFGNNFGVVIGPEIPNALTRKFSEHVVSVVIDGVEAGRKPTGDGEAGPFGAVVFLINHLRANGFDVPPGMIVSTGAITGVHSTHVGTHSVLTFEGFGEFSIDLTEYSNT